MGEVLGESCDAAAIWVPSIIPAQNDVEHGTTARSQGPGTGALGSGVDPTQRPDLEPFRDPALSSLMVVTQRIEMLCLPIGNESQLGLKSWACRLPCFYSPPELGVPICGCTTLHTQV